MESALECRSLSKRFGGLAALTGVDLRVGKGDIFGVIGPNGSGKTTLFNLISGTLKPTSGEIHFEGRKISTLAPDAICRLGIARTYQPVRPFGRLTALENVLVSVCFGRDQSLSRRLRVQDALTVLDFVGLARKAHDTAQSLTIGDRKRLEIARGLATNPKVLLLDEVISGLTPLEQAEIMETVRNIQRRGVTVILIEHVMKVVTRLCSRVAVLHHGAKIAEGPPEAIASDPAVMQAYLGHADRGARHA
jgi:branched-chain amino acid transport system ATP-binding protein